MDYNQDMYNESYWKEKAKLEPKHFIICSEIFKSLSPVNLLDFGCGLGQFVKIFIDMGVNAYGYEPSKYANNHRYNNNIADENCVNDFDVIICFDVLEHVTVEDIDEILGTIKKRSSKESFFVVFSICFKGDPNFAYDKTHITERTKEWWEYKLMKAGYTIMTVPDFWTFKNQMLITKVTNEVKPIDTKN